MRRLALIALAVMATAASGCAGKDSPSPPRESPGGLTGPRLGGVEVKPATPAQVKRLVAASPDIEDVPANLQPPLADAPQDYAVAKSGQRDCNTSEPTPRPRDCVYGDRSGRKTLVLLGDSHAGMWLPAVSLAAERAGWKAILVFRPGCPVPDVHLFDEVAKRPGTACDKWRKWAIGHIAQLRPELVVAASLFRYPRDFDRKLVGDSTWNEGYVRSIGRLKTRGTRVVVLGDIPYIGANPPACLAAHTGDVQACSQDISRAVPLKHLETEEAAVEEAGAKYVNTVPWFCTSETCAAVVGTLSVYRTLSHVGATYSRWLTSVMGRELELSS